MNLVLKKHEDSKLIKGVLAISIKRAFNIDFTKVPSGSNSIKWSYLIVRLQSNHLMSESKAFKIDFLKKECIFDDLRHVSIQVNPQHNNVKNQLKIELILIGYDVKNLEKCTKSLAKHYINVIDLIRVSHVKKDFEMRNCFKSKFRLICSLSIDFCFAYGQFGFGYSNQLKPVKDSYFFEDPTEFIAHSMFPRVEPPHYRKFEENLIEAVTVSYPDIFNSPSKKSKFQHFNKDQMNLPVIYANPSSNLNQFPNLNKVLSERGTSHLDEMLADLSKIDQSNKVQRLNYLQSLLNENISNEFMLSLE